jgi:Winged helix DNA-binding domain
VNADQVLAFRMARSGLAVREARGLAEAAACPASDFAPDAALLALAARAEGVTREGYRESVDAGDLVVAHVVRAAIHALAPGDLALYGRALIARDDDELGAQLGRQVQRLAAEKGFAPSEALDEVATATKDALANGRRLDRNVRHEELRERVRGDVMPWCQSCQSHHVAPMLWRYATVKAGVRLDSERRYTKAKPGRTPAARGAVRRFLGFYGPAKPGDFADWAGLARPHAQRLWDQAAGDLAEVPLGKTKGCS